MVDSPLNETSPSSLDDLMSGDPFGYQRQDRDKIVAELRRMRTLWDEAERQGKRAGPVKTPKQKLSLDQVKNLSLDDLGI